MAESTAHRPASELPAPEQRGTTTIADKVVERVASIAAGEIEAVTHSRSGWAGKVGRELPRADATVAGASARITVDVAAVWPTPLSTLSAEVREHVTSRVATLTGVDVVAVDVTVADVVHLPTARRRVE